MVDAESADLVWIDQYLTKYRNFLGQARQLTCFRNTEFSVSTFPSFTILHSPIDRRLPYAVFYSLYKRGSLGLNGFNSFFNFHNIFFFKMSSNICCYLGWRTRGSI